MKLFYNFERVFVVISLLHYSGGPLANLLDGGASEGDLSVGTPDFALIQLLFFVNYLISFFLIFARWKKVFYIIKKERYIVVLLAISLFSVLWSDAPKTTAVRNVALIGSTAFGVYLATRYSLKEQLQLLALTFGIANVMSILFIGGLPKYGIMSGLHAGKWRGIYTHKNVLGKLMILSGVIFLLTAMNERKHKLLLWGGFALSILLLVMTKSSSAQIDFVTIILIYFILRTLRLNSLLLFPTVFIIATAGEFSYVWLNENADTLLASMGKDSNLTGRGPLWEAVKVKIWQRPWLGYGFSGFWGGWENECADVWRVTGWTPPNAHNGLLDIWIDLGLVGLSTFLVGFVVNLWQGLLWIRTSVMAEGFWPILCMIYFWLSNQTESSLLRQNEIYWLLYVTVIVSMLVPPELSKESEV